MTPANGSVRASSGTPPTRRVLLHVGTPKTGTTYLQDVLFRNRHRLAEQGMLYPAERFDAHFLAALDLMQLPWGGLEQEAVGAWDALAEQVRDWHATSVISHEILARASRAQVARALESLGHPEVEVHLVLSVRDLVRQIPAEWQENIKHRGELSYARFLDQLRDPGREGRIASWFWGVQELPDILDRWGSALPPERIHLVTVPGPGGTPDLLWERFRRAFGLDAFELDQDGERSNPSLGVAETALIRRINQHANRVVPPRTYRPLVRELLAHQTLSRREGAARLTLPPDVHPWAQDLSRSWAVELGERGYDVIGDLDDLVGPDPVAPFLDPDHPDETAVAEAAVDAVRALLVENTRLVDSETGLARRVEELHRELERAHLRPTYRWREKGFRRLSASRGGRLALRVYRRLRGRSSRSA